PAALFRSLLPYRLRLPELALPLAVGPRAAGAGPDRSAEGPGRRPGRPTAAGLPCRLPALRPADQDHRGARLQPGAEQPARLPVADAGRRRRGVAADPLPPAADRPPRVAASGAHPPADRAAGGGAAHGVG